MNIYIYSRECLMVPTESTSWDRDYPQTMRTKKSTLKFVNVSHFGHLKMNVFKLPGDHLK